MSLAAVDERRTVGADDPALTTFAVLSEEGELAPSAAGLVAPELLVRMYREMRRIRLLDERMTLLQRQGRVGFYGACTGQEAASVAAGLAAAADDWIFPGLRENAILLVRGVGLVGYLAQIYGNSADPLKGRQMPNHISAKSVHQVSWSSCIGTQIPHAVGAAMAAKLKGDPVVTIGFLGDGATSTPDFHGAMNFAAVFHAPTVLVCQNNQWAISLPAARQTASATIAVKGRAYGMRAVRVDGNDVVAVYLALSEALARARAGGGPTFLELVTYRMAPHSTSDDPTRYRSADEVETWTRKDPLERLARHLLGHNLWTTRDDEQLEADLLQQIAAAINEVEKHGPPETSTMFEDVYAEQPWHLIEQRTSIQRPPAPAPAENDGRPAEEDQRVDSRGD
jgi:pyruvate dehydrogenase E1 component alpha subunit/2-oxoisovalerate dehydrogenase E1 component alpha subunit